MHFAPSDKSKLISASADGLICTFDTVGDINDDDHLESVSGRPEIFSFVRLTKMLRFLYIHV